MSPHSTPRVSIPSSSISRGISLYVKCIVSPRSSSGGCPCRLIVRRDGRARIGHVRQLRCVRRTRHGYITPRGGAVMAHLPDAQSLRRAHDDGMRESLDRTAPKMSRAELLITLGRDREAVAAATIHRGEEMDGVQQL